MFDHFTPPPTADAGPLATLLDVTLRDGGFEVGFAWPTDLFAQLPAVLAPAGADIVELGYLGGVPVEHGVATPGAGAFLQPEHVEAAAASGMRLAAMVHPTALEVHLDLKAYQVAGLSMLRLVYHPDWFDAIGALAARARDQGLTVSVNIALASRYGREDLLRHAERIDTEIAPDVLYLADTCGALLPTQTADLIGDLRQMSETALGFHAHDFLGLAYANTLAAANAGATYADISILGLGRGGGNLPAELVLARHRLPGRHITTALTALLETRTALATLAERPTPSLLPTVCGTLNLTPVEEAAVVDFAAGESLDLDLAALWLATAHGRLASLHTGDLTAAWKAETTGQGQ
ncbi:hypothetical protein [Streptosporangium lutulentum]|uniref:Isopropylmalate/homocitrate/citramalate synthase n=1 Tax=Streptosporangium lutulentum TaxID=1461250 RepID=A0ABT9QWJ7_9ACTN|nr:hypothetical protein [Streptosporangium lutulentum]MDP9850414.1 isopropylmalate/homocitrate/citramalate synthase [Streptosporangium lutulentum]